MLQELSESLEDYLEAIFHLQEEFKVARVKDIAARLNVKMPSVTNALKVLKSRDLIEYEKNSFITLTEAGEKLAKKITHKHEVCEDFFSGILNAGAEESRILACAVEHYIAEKTASKIENLSGLIRDYCEKDSAFSDRITAIRNS